MCFLSSSNPRMRSECFFHEFLEHEKMEHEEYGKRAEQDPPYEMVVGQKAPMPMLPMLPPATTQTMPATREEFFFQS